MFWSETLKLKKKFKTKKFSYSLTSFLEKNGHTSLKKAMEFCCLALYRLIFMCILLSPLANFSAVAHSQ